MDDNPSPSIKRRLAAILAADIAGYSRLMGEDEAATVRDLKGHLTVILPLVAATGIASSTPRAVSTSRPGSKASRSPVASASLTRCSTR
jgi:hypothetical protein